MAFIFRGRVNKFIKPSASLWSYNSLSPKEDMLSSYKACSVNMPAGFILPLYNFNLTEPVTFSWVYP